MRWIRRARNFRRSSPPAPSRQPNLHHVPSIPNPIVLHLLSPPFAHATVQVLRYAAILDDVVAQAPSVSAKERNDLYTLFQASQLAEGGATPDAAAQLELLKSVMAIGEATPA